jgi:hypothetical protein
MFLDVRDRTCSFHLPHIFPSRPSTRQEPPSVIINLHKLFGNKNRTVNEYIITKPGRPTARTTVDTHAKIIMVSSWTTTFSQTEGWYRNPSMIFSKSLCATFHRTCEGHMG